jgi:hypothetical protein
VSTKTIFLGVDPGAGGGLVALDRNGNAIKVDRMPKTEYRVWDWFSDWIGNDQVIGVIEKVGGYIAKPNAIPGAPSHTPGSAMFWFGASYGGLRMCLTVIGLIEDESYWAVAPVTWQKALNCGHKMKGEKQSDHKRRMKEQAQKMFPKVRVTLHTADALLLAVHCLGKYGGIKT